MKRTIPAGINHFPFEVHDHAYTVNQPVIGTFPTFPFQTDTGTYADRFFLHMSGSTAL